ncbi:MULTISPECIES: hypothetical protein [unclassified Streptomyces]|uniref:hypothetical protein n=1 Tax=unclassified Streptomyces TaxID=2593676 RepID=UPI0013710EF8|nr:MULTISPECIES: hypothetical protein [unclassified Streptomyces]MCW5251669.1 hypothetical protein [Streptomyces sp. SHP 1-2]MYU25734.1 hypothetical protein [Streptomyces sp. SID8352]
MARHTSPRSPHAQRVLIALASAGAALAAGAATASADSGETLAGLAHTRPTSVGDIDPQAGVEALAGTVGYVTGPVADLKPNPLAGTGVDPLDNGVGTQIADFQPLTSTALTGPVAQAQSLGGIPVVGQVTGLLR